MATRTLTASIPESSSMGRHLAFLPIPFPIQMLSAEHQVPGNSKYLYHSVYFKFKFWCWSQLYKPQHQFPNAHLTVVCWKGLWAGFWPPLWPCVAWARVWPSLGLQSTHLQVGIDCLDQLPQPFWATKNFEILLKAMDTLLGEKKKWGICSLIQKVFIKLLHGKNSISGLSQAPWGFIHEP